MESSSSSSSSRRSLLHTHTSTTTPQRFLSKRIEPAIRGKSCPICLNHIGHRRAAVITACLHAYCVDCIRRWSDLKRNCPLCNAVFDAWFSQINLSSRTFLKHKLPEISEDIRKLNVEALRSRRRVLVVERRVLRRSREEFDCVNGRTRPLSRQRWFGRSGSESSNSVAERVLQWRASIYEQHLRAVPCFSQSCLEQNTAGNNGVKDRILKRIEPWIHRELKAILGIQIHLLLCMWHPHSLSQALKRSTRSLPNNLFLRITLLNLCDLFCMKGRISFGMNSSTSSACN